MDCIECGASQRVDSRGWIESFNAFIEAHQRHGVLRDSQTDQDVKP
ncbi:MAG: hypothetical protein ACYC2H_00290 [Thermoplasmatota archaeon]